MKAILVPACTPALKEECVGGLGRHPRDTGDGDVATLLTVQEAEVGIDRPRFDALA
jgi:hypothetical protein